MKITRRTRGINQGKWMQLRRNAGRGEMRLLTAVGKGRKLAGRAKVNKAKK